MPAVTRLNDPTSCGGSAVEAVSSVFADGIAVHVLGNNDTCAWCSPPGQGAISSGSPSVFVEGIPVARVNDPDGCGAVMSAGSTSTFADGS